MQPEWPATTGPTHNRSWLSRPSPLGGAVNCRVAMPYEGEFKTSRIAGAVEPRTQAQKLVPVGKET